MLSATRAFTASRVGPSRVSVSRTALVSVARPVQHSSLCTGGTSLVSFNAPRAPARGALVVVAAKKSMGCTLGGTNRKRARVTGFRARMKTNKGIKLLKARRAKGRHCISPSSMKKSGGKK